MDVRLFFSEIEYGSDVSSYTWNGSGLSLDRECRTKDDHKLGNIDIAI